MFQGFAWPMFTGMRIFVNNADAVTWLDEELKRHCCCRSWRRVGTPDTLKPSLGAPFRHPWRKRVRRTDPPPLIHINARLRSLRKVTSNVCAMNPNTCYGQNVLV